MTKPTYWNEAIKYLSKADPTLKKIIQQYKGETLKARGDGFYTLARSIVGQQISVKAADSVWNKLLKLIPSPLGGGLGRGQVTPTSVLDAPLLASPLWGEELARITDEQLRSCGLSAQKVKYLRAVAEYFADPPDFKTMEDAELLASLTSIHGVGVWTAEMFMIFHLLKPDVLPLGDIGLLKAIGVHYGDGSKVEKSVAEEIAEPWKPYRSVATWYLWRSLDPVPVEY